MLHLDAGVDFNKIEAAVGRDQKLHRAGIDIADILHEPDGGGADFSAQLFRQAPGRRHLHQLLMAPLHGAVPLEQMDDIALPVTEKLHFDVFRTDQQFFQVNLVTAEGSGGFRFGLAVCRL